MAQLPLEDRVPHSLTRVIAAALITVAGLALVNLVFYYLYREGCSGVASWKFCEFSKHTAERGIALIAIFGVYCMGRPSRCASLLQAARGSASIGPATLLLTIGTALIIGPALVAHNSPGDTTLLIGVTSWALGTMTLAAGALRLLAPWSVWGQTFKHGAGLLAPLLLAGLFLPELGDLLFPLWHMDAVRSVTFDAVVWASHLIGLTLEQNAPDYILGQGDFFVRVNQSCSGIEGFVLITVFLLGYTLIFWRQIRVGRVLAMLPLALAISWALNVTRIALLIWLGVNVSPTLAVEGFHSHAGWLMFSVLSLGLMAVLHMIPWFQRRPATTGPAAPAPALPPLSQDWNVARILPFAVFMFSALLASTFFQHPALAYPLRVALMVGALWVFHRALARLSPRVDTVALGTGLAIGLAWIATTPAQDPDAAQGLQIALAGLGGVALTIWIAARIIGTAILVPVIEELFFRSYLLDRLIPKRTWPFILLGVAISTAAFAILHDRWLAAALAGLVFAWLALRPQGRVEDAILSHMVANAAIALAALLSGNWALI
ncbi:MAG: exosortase E/protease, VPEID-CTERM system [Pseudomonadota bacterium]